MGEQAIDHNADNIIENTRRLNKLEAELRTLFEKVERLESNR
jgi:uncharacterized coiled-coil protein SlyX